MGLPRSRHRCGQCSPADRLADVSGILARHELHQHRVGECDQADGGGGEVHVADEGRRGSLRLLKRQAGHAAGKVERKVHRGRPARCPDHGRAQEPPWHVIGERVDGDLEASAGGSLHRRDRDDRVLVVGIRDVDDGRPDESRGEASNEVAAQVGRLGGVVRLTLGEVHLQLGLVAGDGELIGPGRVAGDGGIAAQQHAVHVAGPVMAFGDHAHTVRRNVPDQRWPDQERVSEPGRAIQLRPGRRAGQPGPAPAR